MLRMCKRAVALAALALLLVVPNANGIFLKKASLPRINQRTASCNQLGFSRQLSIRGGVQDNYYYQGDGDDFDDEYWDDEDDGDYQYLPQEAAPAPGLSAMDLLAGGGTQNRKLGFMLCGSGCIVTLIGVTLFFNGMLLKLGNLMFVSGLPLVIGPSRTVAYFTNPSRLRATATFAFGLFLVLMAGWPISGLFFEFFGFLNLFGNFFPLLKGILTQLPGFSRIFSPSQTPPRRDYYDQDYSYR